MGATKGLAATDTVSVTVVPGTLRSIAEVITDACPGEAMTITVPVAKTVVIALSRQCAEGTRQVQQSWMEFASNALRHCHSKHLRTFSLRSPHLGMSQITSRRVYDLPRFRQRSNVRSGRLSCPRAESRKIADAARMMRWAFCYRTRILHARLYNVHIERKSRNISLL
jgi:hypothetical protein